MAKEPTKEFMFKLKPETANLLFGLLSQQEQHAKRAEKEGHPELLNEFNRIYTFYNALAGYLNEIHT